MDAASACRSRELKNGSQGVVDLGIETSQALIERRVRTLHHPRQILRPGVDTVA
jgi:hypothetical protein